jgi:hypothetical protein
VDNGASRGEVMLEQAQLNCVVDLVASLELSDDSIVDTDAALVQMEAVA